MPMPETKVAKTGYERYCEYQKRHPEHFKQLKPGYDKKYREWRKIQKQFLLILL